MRPTEKFPIAHRMDGQLLSIIMPFYNEGEVIVRNVSEVIAACEEMGISFEIVLVDDGSRDGGFVHLQRVYKHDSRVVCIRNEINFGKGWALKTGYEFCRGDLILFLDSDLELSPWHIPQFLTRLFEEKVDAVIGSKLHPDSEVEYPMIRRILSTGYYFLIRLLFSLPIMDTQTGIKLFRRGALECALPRTLVKRFAFDIELLVIMVSYNFRVTSAPVALHFSRGGIGNVRFKTIWNIFLDTLAVVYRFHILHYYRRELGKPHSYRYRVILFSQEMGEYEQVNLQRYLSLPYVDYDVVLLGPEKPIFSHPKLRWLRTSEKLFSCRLRVFLESEEEKRDVYLFGTLAFFPDPKIFLNTGRILSLTEVGMIGGFVMPAVDETPEGRFFYHILRSVFLNGPLSYRYKHGVQKKVEELGLEGSLVKREILEVWFQHYTHHNHEKLEHQLSQVCRLMGRDSLYSPDVVMYGYFPKTTKECFRWLTHQAIIRSYQKEGLRAWYVLFSGLLALWLLLFLSPWLSPWLALPWGAYYGFMWVIWPLVSDARGIKKLFSGFFLSFAQFVYVGSFLTSRLASWYKQHV